MSRYLWILVAYFSLLETAKALKETVRELHKRLGEDYNSDDNPIPSPAGKKYVTFIVLYFSG